MQSKSKGAHDSVPMPVVVRPLIERRLQRFCLKHRAAIETVAARHRNLADLAVSFPGLLFTLAVPRRGLEADRAINHAMAGANLATLAQLTELPLWLRKLPPEAFVRPIGRLPDGEFFSRQIANHLPRSPKLMPVWLQTVAQSASSGSEDFAVWAARQLLKKKLRFKQNRLQLLSLWSWYSLQPEQSTPTRRGGSWRPSISYEKAMMSARDWLDDVSLHLNLGDEGISDMWLEAATFDGYDFVPLRTSADIMTEAQAMKNCLVTYGDWLRTQTCRLWSARKNGERVASISLEISYKDRLLTIREIKGPENQKAAGDIAWAARKWLHSHELINLDDTRRGRREVEFNRKAWAEMWRPYWLAKGRIPQWLPLCPSTEALYELGWS